MSEYVIRHGGAFYRTNAQGYTYNLAEAGRWTEAEAAKHRNDDPFHKVTVHHVSEFNERRADAFDAKRLAEWLRWRAEHTAGADNADMRLSFDRAADLLEGYQTRAEKAEAERDEAERFANLNITDREREWKARAEAAEAESARLRDALKRLVNANALKGVREQVAGWNGEHLPEDQRYGRHPARLGAQIKTNCGAIYELDEALTAARALTTEGGEAC